MGNVINTPAAQVRQASQLTAPDGIRQEHGLTIKEKLIPDGCLWLKDDRLGGRVWARKGDLYKAQQPICGPKSITIHNPGAGQAEVFVRATLNQNMHSARVHYYVDDREGWQMLREDEAGWHAGDGMKRGGGNATSLAIEICMGRLVHDGAKAEQNGALLCALLLRRQGLLLVDGITVRTHKSWTPQDKSKQCPIAILPHWPNFIEKVRVALEGMEQSGNGVPLPLLRRDDKMLPSDDVSRLQTLLLAAGFDPKGIDGRFGPNTDAALRAFQKARGLVVDGIAGAKTWGAVLTA